jgi:hypothetical protein
VGTDWLYDLAANFTGIPGIVAVYCGDGDGASVRALPDVLETPCVVVVDGADDIIAATWERHTFAPEVRVYVSRQGRSIGEAYETARSFRGALLGIARNTTGVDGITALVPIRFRAIEDAQWPAESGNWYLVLPLELQAKLSQAAAYGPPA